MSFRNFTEFHYENLTDAWEGMNEFLANREVLITRKGGGVYGSEFVSFNNLVTISKCKLDPKFNFGRVLGYTYKKWTKLVNNYCNMNYLDLIKAEVQEREGKNAKAYNYTYHFDNVHGSGKDCLISLTFTRRKNEPGPIVIYTTRASEITKRLVFDFLLIQRMVEYVYGKEQQVQLICFIPFMYINLECFLMYVAHYGRKNVIKKNKKGFYSPYQERMIKKYKEFLKVDASKVKYKVHQRAVMQVQRNPDGSPASNVKDCFAKNLVLVHKEPRIKDIEKLNASLVG